MRKQNILLSFVLMLAGVLCIAPSVLFVLILGMPSFDEWRAKQNLRLIEDAQYLFEDLGLYGGSSSQRSIYYWVNKPIEEVKTYYEDFTSPFIVSEIKGRGTWQIALIQQGDNTIPPQPPPASYFNTTLNTTHESFCNYKQRYDCITIALVDASQPDLYRLAVSSPTMFTRSDNPPEFVSLQYGTLIIYSYYVYDY